MRDTDFDLLVRRHTGSVSAYARALCRDTWQAEEATQETFLRAWKYLDSYSNKGSFEGWLLRICRNCITDLAAREARHGGATSELIDVGVEPDQVSELHELLRRLPLAQREVLVLCRFLGYDYDAAATILDVPIGTVRSRLSRARDNLDALLHASDPDVRTA